MEFYVVYQSFEHDIAIAITTDKTKAEEYKRVCEEKVMRKTHRPDFCIRKMNLQENNLYLI